MMRDFSNILDGKKQVVRGQALKIGSDGFLGKSFGVIITVTMLCGLVVSFMLTWMIQDGLNDLAKIQERKTELITMQKTLVAERKQILVQENFEMLAEGLGLYPVSAGQVRRF